ncbi:hypothetical protein L6R46_09775 [Myxococcota bacterium]|jgi:hypothetical protein|nr:hypothetical protein [Myxococcota bacterium]
MSSDDQRYPLHNAKSHPYSNVWFRNGGTDRLAQDVDCPMGVEFCEDVGLRWTLYEIEFSRDGQQWIKTVYWAPNEYKLQDAYPELVHGPACFTIRSEYDPSSAAAALHYYFMYISDGH